MSEDLEIFFSKEGRAYFPEKTHDKWYKARTVGLYAFSAFQAFAAGLAASKAATLIEVSRQVGGTLTPELLQSFATSANMNDAKAAILAVGSLVFFGMGTAGVIRSTIRDK